MRYLLRRLKKMVRGTGESTWREFYLRKETVSEK
jgi:hypothetical protein